MSRGAPALPSPSMRVSVVVGLDNWLWGTWKVFIHLQQDAHPEPAEKSSAYSFSLGIMIVFPVLGSYGLGSAIVESKAVD